MNRSPLPLLILVIVLIPLGLRGQTAASPLNESGSLSAIAVSSSGDSGSVAFEKAGDVTRESAQGAHGSAKQSPSKVPASASTGEPNVPPIDDSRVGYVDNAIIGSQIRIRLDANLQDQTPDFAEFFYAKSGYYKTLCTPTTQAGCDPIAPGPGPGIPNSINFQQLFLNAEYAPKRRFSIFVELPIRWIQPQGIETINPPQPVFGKQSGFSDVQAGFKLAAIASEKTYLTFQLRGYFPSGNAAKGLGTNHYSVEPSLLLYQRLSKRFTFEGEIGDWHPIGGSAGDSTVGSGGFAGDVFFYGFGPSYELPIHSNRFGIAPVLELVGWRTLSGFWSETNPFQTPDPADTAAGTNMMNLKAGARFTIGNHNSLYAGYGRAITSNYWYLKIFRIEYRYAF
jgi:hypothetical protein